MLSTISSKIILQNDSYLSFPDIINNPYKPRQYFIIFREGESHHPTWSNLILMSSEDHGKKWAIIKKFSMDLEKNGYVWNCPRFYYNQIEQSLNIICDIKNTTTESTAHFKILNLKSYDEGRSFTRTLTEMPGMLPDRVLPFKGRLYCANHKIKPDGHKLVQLVSWSRDNGRTWFDTNLLANDPTIRFCEASLVNIKDQYLIAYLRDNSDHVRPLFKTISEDGINWTLPEPMKIMGQRATALLLNEDTVLISYRNTKDVAVSIFIENIKNNILENFNIDYDVIDNLYHFGYSGICKIDNNHFYIVYYIRNKENFPFIKLAKIKLD